MQSTAPRISLTTLSTAFILILAAVVILIAWTVEDWFLLLPLFLLGVGLYLVIVSFTHSQAASVSGRRSDINYLMFWGNLMAVFGLILLVNHWYPGNGMLLLIAFIAWLGISIIIFGLRPKIQI